MNLTYRYFSHFLLSLNYYTLAVSFLRIFLKKIVKTKKKIVENFLKKIKKNKIFEK